MAPRTCSSTAWISTSSKVSSAASRWDQAEEYLAGQARREESAEAQFLVLATKTVRRMAPKLRPPSDPN